MKRRFKHQLSLQQRLALLAHETREQANRLPAGPVREALLKKARQTETASHVDGWINSAGLQPPK